MMNLLERAGLVRSEGGPVDDRSEMAQASEDPGTPQVAQASPEPALPIAESTGMTLVQIYATAAVPQSPYPAERLMRLMDGLKEMDEEMRRKTIHAIDAADDSWTIDDPIADAKFKIMAIDRHIATIKDGYAHAENETTARLSELKQQQDVSLAEIRRQIAELEGLLSRKVAQGAQELAGIESELRSSKEASIREIDNLTRTATALQALIGQFNNSTKN